MIETIEYPETPQLWTLCLTKAPATDGSGGVGRHSHGKIHQSPDTHESNSHNSNYFKDFPTKPVDTERGGGGGGATIIFKVIGSTRFAGTSQVCANAHNCFGPTQEK